MGTFSSSYYYSKIIEIEQKIANEFNLAGVSQADNGEDTLELDNRLKELRDLQRYYEKEYNIALAKEGQNVDNFVPRRETGN